MLAVQSMRMFVCDRLTAAADEIFGLFERKLEDYEKEIDRQRRILDAVLNPEVRLRRAELRNFSTTTSVAPQEAVKREQTEPCVAGGRPQTPRQRDPDGCEPTRVEEERLSRNTEATRFQNGQGDSPDGFPDEREAFSPDGERLTAQEDNGEHHVGSPSLSAGRQCHIADTSLSERTSDEEGCRNNNITRKAKLVIENKCSCSSVTGGEPMPSEDVASTSEQIPGVKVTTSASADANSEREPGDGKATAPPNGTPVAVRTRASTTERGAVSGATTPARGEEIKLRKRWNHGSSPTDVRTDRTSRRRRTDTDVDPRGDLVPSGRDGHNGEWSRLYRSAKSKSDGEASAASTAGSDDPYRYVVSNVKNSKFQVRSHTFAKSFRCDACGLIFRDRSTLNQHRLVHPEVKPFRCAVCQKGFTRRFNLELHGRVHTGEKPFVCGACGKAFTSSANRNRHARIHSAEKPYTCSGCGKAFADSSVFKNHLRVHSGEKPFRCSVCNQRFATRTTLKRHGRVHTGEKPYKCAVCQKAFGLKSVLNSHVRTHTGETPYPCGSCGDKFSTWLKLSRHKRTRHGGCKTLTS